MARIYYHGASRGPSAVAEPVMLTHCNWPTLCLIFSSTLQSLWEMLWNSL